MKPSAADVADLVALICGPESLDALAQWLTEQGIVQDYGDEAKG